MNVLKIISSANNWYKKVLASVSMGAESTWQQPLGTVGDISGQFKLRTHEWVMMLAAFILPMHRIAASYSGFVLLFYWLLSGSFRRSLPGLTKERDLWPLWIFLLLQWAGLLYTEHMSEGLFDLKIKFSLLLIPLFMSGAPRLSAKAYRLSLAAFVAGTITSSFISLALAMNRAGSVGKSAFYYVDLLKYAHMHPSYFALFVCTSILILFRFALITRGGARIGIIGAILYLMVFLLLLSARMQIFLMFLVGNIALLGHAARRGHFLKWMAIIVLINGTLVGVLSQLDFVKQRIESLELVNNSDIPNSANSRLLIWQSAKKILMEHPVLGVGTGDVEAELYKQYVASDFELGIKQHYNAHNQYIHTWLASGIAGLMALLATLIVPGIRALRSKRSLFPLLLLFFALSMLVESMMESQMGVGWFAFFLGFFSFQDRSITDGLIENDSTV